MPTQTDHRHPEVRNDLLAWGEWVLDTTGGTGVRLDAIKHYDHTFALEFVRQSAFQDQRRCNLPWFVRFEISVDNLEGSCCSRLLNIGLQSMSSSLLPALFLVAFLFMNLV